MTIQQNLHYAGLIVILLFTAIFLLVNLSSCEGMRCAEGTIYDKSTQKPLDSVQCKILTFDNRVMYSDSVGHYEVCNGFGGCVPDCSDIEIEFSKQGFKTTKIKNPDYKQAIYLEK